MRQYAYDRFLTRVFTGPDADRWVLKGATALLVRLGGDARHTVDIDLLRSIGDLDDADRAVRQAVARDAGDHFRFALGPGRRMAEASVALRVPVQAYLGATVFARFNLDLVAELEVTGEPEVAGPLLPVEIPGIVQAEYRIYPLADHVADKVMALLQRHDRRGALTIDSTRYRDLADLVVIAHRSKVNAAALHGVLGRQAARRGMELPTHLRPPQTRAWEIGYARTVRDLPGMVERDLASAAATANRFIDPVLQGSARGGWDPEVQAWT
ncbi:MAG: nucleotidyl transferase AbiEii/AbiGii toxin family protein [Candidatus Dormibacteraceae bacterium]